MLSLSYIAIAYCAVVIVLAYGVRGSTGFGSAAAMPLLALVIPLKVLVPGWTLLGVASSVTIVARDYRQVALAELLRTGPGGAVRVGRAPSLFEKPGRPRRAV